MNIKQELTKLFKRAAKADLPHWEQYGWPIDISIGDILLHEYGIDPHLEMQKHLPYGVVLQYYPNKLIPFIGFGWKDHIMAFYDGKLNKIVTCELDDILDSPYHTDDGTRYVCLGPIEREEPACSA